MKKVMLFVIIMGIGLFIIGSWLFTNTYGASSPNEWTLGGVVKFIFEDTKQLPPPDQNQYTQHGIGLHFEERTPPLFLGQRNILRIFPLTQRLSKLISPPPYPLKVSCLILKHTP